MMGFVVALCHTARSTNLWKQNVKRGQICGGKNQLLFQLPKSTNSVAIFRLQIALPIVGGDASVVVLLEPCVLSLTIRTESAPESRETRLKFNR